MASKNKTRKRKVAVHDERKRYGFHTFGDPGYPCDFKGTFLDNIQELVQNYAELEDSDGTHLAWSTLLVVDEKRSGGFVVPLYTIKETVPRSFKRYCKECQCIGWSHHLLSKTRYHLIIPVNDESPNKSGLIRCTGTHLLHGLIHCNGFGHLLNINGLEGGSKFLRGRDVMNLWDRICMALRVRMINVHDVSNKRSMDLRLLYGVAYGHPWFGKWGYKFGHGSFGITEDGYNTAICKLRSLNLDEIFKGSGGGKDRNHMEKIIRYYQGQTETHLITIEDLLRYMLFTRNAVSKPHSPIKPITGSVQHRLPFEGVIKKRRSRSNKHNKDTDSNKSKSNNTSNEKPCKLAADLTSENWSSKRLENAAGVIVDVLIEKGPVMYRQKLRDEAKPIIRDTGLLDHVLKSMGNVVVGKYIVRRAQNKETKLLEFTIHDLGGEDVTAHITSKNPGLDVYNDILFLYRELLLQGYDGNTITEPGQLSARTVLDNKNFVKEWPLKEEEDSLSFVCRLKLKYESPGELVIVPIHTTIGELKRKVECTFRDTYCSFQYFSVTGIEGLGELPDDEYVASGFVEPGADIWVSGDLKGRLEYQGGNDRGTVDCICGAQDEDGERLAVCIACDIWQHTRCNGISDADAVDRESFLCDTCSANEGGIDNISAVNCICGDIDCDGERMVGCDFCGVYLQTGCIGYIDADTGKKKLFFCVKCSAL